MISRLTFSAAVFAVLATATISFAAETHQQQRAERSHQSAAIVANSNVVVLPTVEIFGHRAR